mmetsp:Transcript_16608/g.30210  ORF Transcript_16608/g.30210 Transcript_16608/m.30210 type:complete len:89 (+) Transcript_16608:406-672(+)
MHEGSVSPGKHAACATFAPPSIHATPQHDAAEPMIVRLEERNFPDTSGRSHSSFSFCPKHETVLLMQEWECGNGYMGDDTRSFRNIRL